MKQTSIEWLVEQVFGKHTYVWKDVIQQAKEMHKQEIIDAFGIVCHHESKRSVGYQHVAEQYYNETFTQDKQ
jgi:hypothetical protein